MSEPTLHHKWNNGDFTIKTSDNFKFLIPSYHLQSASRVLRDMMEAGSRAKRIELDEPSSTLDDFLDLTVSGLISFSEPEDCAYAVALAQFVKKYECEAAIEHILCNVRLETKRLKYCTPQLLMAMHLDDRDVVANAIDGKSAEFLKWFCFSRGRAFPFKTFELVPSTYVYALIMADLHNPQLSDFFDGKAGKWIKAGPVDRFLCSLRFAEESDSAQAEDV